MSCDVLEVGDELIPLVTDAVTSVDVENKVIEIDREFLGL
jgi:ribosomal 30S subunit maturation factor RimM